MNHTWIYYKLNKKRKKNRVDQNLLIYNTNNMFRELNIFLLLPIDISAKIASVWLINILRHCSNVSRVSTIE